jgi:PAS domain S-box-containing protein
MQLDAEGEKVGNALRRSGNVAIFPKLRPQPGEVRGPSWPSELLPYRPPAAGRPVGPLCFDFFPLAPQNVKKQIPVDAALASTMDLPRAMEDLAAPACVIDREGRFRWLNRAYIELLGDRRGQPFVDAIVPEQHALARTNFARKVVGKTTRIYDLRVIDRLGNTLTLRTTAAPLWHGGKVVGVFGIGIPLDDASAPKEASFDQLTPRQQEVLRLLGEGLETQDIAKRLGIADETARNHIRGLLRAIGAHSRLEAVVMGMRMGVLDPHLAQPGSAAGAED